MKVILACQIVSHAASSAMHLHIKQGEIPPEATETDEFQHLVNNMWDIVDSHFLDAPPGKKAVTDEDDLA